MAPPQLQGQTAIANANALAGVEMTELGKSAKAEKDTQGLMTVSPAKI